MVIGDIAVPPTVAIGIKFHRHGRIQTAHPQGTTKHTGRTAAGIVILEGKGNPVRATGVFCPQVDGKFHRKGGKQTNAIL